MPIPVLFISSGVFHPSLAARFAVERRLARSREFTLYHSNNLEELPELDWSQFAALALFYQYQVISTNALDALDAYAQEGGGILAIHCATASYKDRPTYQRILGARFTGHGPVSPFRVEPDPAQRDIFGVAATFTLQDQLYFHEHDPGSQVHFWARTPTGREPLVWTRMHGRGKVCCCSAGHTLASLSSPQVQQILLRGLRWVGSEE